MDGTEQFKQNKKNPKYAFKMIKNCTAIMFGYAPKNINKSGNNYNSCGYYVYSANGYKYGQGISCSQFQSGMNQNNVAYGIKYDKKKVKLLIITKKINWVLLILV